MHRLIDKIIGQRSPHVRYDPRAAPAPALAPFHYARLAPDRRCGVERVLVLRRLPGRGHGRCLARTGGEIRPGLRLRQALGGWLPVPPRSPLRRRQRVAAVADRGTGRDASGDHRKARRNPCGGAGLRSETADRGIYRPGDNFRSRPAAFDGGELEQGAQQRGGAAGRPAANLARLRRCLDRSYQWTGAGAARARQTY